MIGVIISSILFLIGLFAYGGYTRMTRIEESLATTQQQFIYAQRFMEKDVHMSGYALSGNGLYTQGLGSAQFKLYFFRNDNNTATVLSADANPGDIRVLVANGHGCDTNQWMCLSHDSTSRFYPVARIRFNTGLGGDTVWLKTATISDSWNHATALVKFVKGIWYSIDSAGTTKSLVRHCGAQAIAIGTLIDTLGYVSLDSLGFTVGNAFAKARCLRVVFGSHAKTASPNSTTIKTFDVMIRNWL